MTPIVPLITAFLREHMPIERGYSPNTCETYAHAFRLLFEFAAGRLEKRPVLRKNSSRRNSRRVLTVKSGLVFAIGARSQSPENEDRLHFARDGTLLDLEGKKRESIRILSSRRDLFSA